MVEILLDFALLILFTSLLGLGAGLLVTTLLIVAGVVHG